MQRLLVTAALATATAAAIVIGGEQLADHPIQGKRLFVTNDPSPAVRPSARFVSSDPSIAPLAAVGDPTVTGATIELLNPTPGLEQSRTFSLPASNWRKVRRGFRYRDPDGTHGPTLHARLLTQNLVVRMRGDSMTYLLGQPQERMGIIVTVTPDRYCAEFGGVIYVDDGVRFIGRRAPAPEVCPSVDDEECEPSKEICDGVDNDCDEAVDEDLGDVTCGVGQCQNSVPACEFGVPQQCVPLESSAEICDLIDNDCDGNVDEDLGTIDCGCGISVSACLDGAPEKCPQVVGDEFETNCSDGIDNDCDGLTDGDDFDCD